MANFQIKIEAKDVEEESPPIGIFRRRIKGMVKQIIITITPTEEAAQKLRSSGLLQQPLMNVPLPWVDREWFAVNRIEMEPEGPISTELLHQANTDPL